MATREEQRETRRRLMRRWEQAVLQSRDRHQSRPRMGPTMVAYGVPFDPNSASNAELHAVVGRLEESLSGPPPRPWRHRRGRPRRGHRRFLPWRARRPHWNPTARSNAKAAAEQLSWRLLNQYGALGILMIGVGDAAGEPVVVVFVHDPDMSALPNVIPSRVGGVRVVIRPGQPGILPQLGTEPERTGRERLRDGLMIAAPIMIFGTLIFLSTTGPARPPNWRR
jgi:hypothetical protein